MPRSGQKAELEALKAAAQQRIAAGQGELNLGLGPAGGGPLPITSSKMGHLLDALERGYRVLGFEASRAWPGGAAGPRSRMELSRRPSGRLDRQSR